MSGLRVTALLGGPNKAQSNSGGKRAAGAAVKDKPGSGSIFVNLLGGSRGTSGSGASTPGTTKGPATSKPTPKANKTVGRPSVSKGARGAPSKASTSYTLLGSPFPLRPVFERRTLMKTVVPNVLWTFEQPQGLGFSNVTINTRMTVIRMSSGGLWVHAPIAPTQECLEMVRSLGEVEHIVLPTFAIEHKVFFGPFARNFPNASLWVAPKQWSFPLNLPLSFLGLGFRSVQELSDDLTPEECSWRQDIDLRVNCNDSFSEIGPYCEVAFFHSKTKTLLVTDCVVQVPRQPLEIVDPELLIDAAAPNPLNPFSPKPADSPVARALGWRRMCTQVLFFGPQDLTNPDETFEKLCEPQVICSPVVRTLVFSKVPRATIVWAEGIARDWAFDKIISCHFTGPFKCTPRRFLESFQFCYDAAGIPLPQKEIPGSLPFELPFDFGSVKAVDFDRDTPGDMRILRGLNDLLIKAGAVDTTGEKSS